MTIWAVFICFAGPGCLPQQTMTFRTASECHAALRMEWRAMTHGPGVRLECKSKHIETWR